MAAEKPWVIDVVEHDFEGQVIEKSRELPVVVDFWAPWCAPCRVLGPVLEKLAAEAAGKFLLAKVDIDEAPALATSFRVHSIPQVVAFRDGRVAGQFAGALPEGELREFLKKLEPSETARLVTGAAELEDVESDQAEDLYRQALDLDRQHDPAKLGLARLLVERGADDEAAAVLGRVVPGGENAQEVERLQSTVALRGLPAGDEAEIRERLAGDPESAQLHFELGCALAAAGKHPEALEELVTAARLDKALGKERARDVMVKIFHVVGARSDLADEYRSRLSRALY